MAHILIVEDNTAITKLLRVRLEQRGHTITAVADGAQVGPCVYAQAPDLILLDVMLPRVGGFQVARQLKLDMTTRHIPIVMLSVRSDAQSVMTGIEGGADVYLTKPIDFPELLRSIETCLKHSAPPAHRPPSDE
jgi:DNA-binding response OmpR family regulator